MKVFTVAIVRDILDQFFKEKVSYSRMVELLNERVEEVVMLNVDIVCLKCDSDNVVLTIYCNECNEAM